MTSEAESAKLKNTLMVLLIIILGPLALGTCGACGLTCLVASDLGSKTASDQPSTLHRMAQP